MLNNSYHIIVVIDGQDYDQTTVFVDRICGNGISPIWITMIQFMYEDVMFDDGKLKIRTELC